MYSGLSYPISIARITSSGLMSAHALPTGRLNVNTGASQRLWSWSSPSFNGTTRDFQQAGDASAIADGGDQYTGLDRFGRISDQNWVNTAGGPSTDRFQYAYDQDGNVLYKNNLVAPTFSELYHANSSSTYDNSSAYDNFGQLTGFSRGTLSASGNNGPGGLDKIASGDVNEVVTENTANWNLDPLGNWTSSSVNGGTATDRTTNSGNELTAIGGSSLGYDDNGNLISGATGSFTYDAWNRLITENSSAPFAYDALGQRIGQKLDGSSGRSDYYYSADGHEIEDHSNYCSGDGLSITDQYVWGLGGPNELILRDSIDTTNTDGAELGTATSGLACRLYVEQDANENVTALVGPDGTAVNHFVYDPYGAVTTINGTYTATASNTYGMSYLFQGGKLDPAGLYHFRARDLLTDGRWLQQDPAGYVDVG